MIRIMYKSGDQQLTSGKILFIRMVPYDAWNNRMFCSHPE